MDKNTNEKDIQIFIDSHEAGTKVASILKKKCRIEEKPLDTDYILSEHAACERKTTKDFLKSIVDGRLFRQVSELKERYEKPFMIIEGDDLFNNDTKIHPNAVRGALASIALEFSMPILWTKSQFDTAELLFAIAKREQLQLKKSVTIRNKKRFRSMNQMQEFLVSGIADIGSETSRKLLKHFVTPQRIFTASESELQEVDGVGKKTAKKIRTLLISKYEKSILE
ncbi:MAG: ERCC4 domain-containing protein [Candidatus Aenigmatarchaeota archaeon]